MAIGIYKITNPKGKVYVGQSVNILKRVNDYKNHKNCKSQTRLSRSIEKYGWDLHKFEMIETCEESELNTRERFWQDHYHVLDTNGLNCRLTTTVDKSGSLSVKTKNKISKSLEGHEVSQITKDKIGLANHGRIPSIETRRKLSDSNPRSNASLSDIEVHTICKMYMNGATSQDIKAIFPFITSCTLSEIRHKKSYKHISVLYDLTKPTKVGCTRQNKLVLCVEDNLSFNGIIEAGEYYSVSFRSISKSALTNKRIKKINKTFIYA